MKTRFFAFVAMITVLAILVPVGFAKEPEKKELPEFVEAVLKEMPKEYRLAKESVVFLQDAAELDALELPVDQATKDVMKRDYAAFQYLRKVYVCGWVKQYFQSAELFAKGHNQVVWLWVARMAHEQYHTLPHPDLKSVQEEELVAYKLQLALIEQFESEGKFAGMVKYVATQKEFLRSIISGSVPTETYVIAEKITTQ